MSTQISYANVLPGWVTWDVFKVRLCTLVIKSEPCRLLEPEQLKILKASEVLALNQDPLGVAGDLIWKQGPNEVDPL